MAILGNLGNYKNFGLLVARIGLGVMFIYHGIPNLTGGMRTWTDLGHATTHIGIHIWPAFWGLMCAVTETFGGFLIIIGLAFRPVCFLMVITMIVAALSQFYPHHDLGAASHAIEDAFTFFGLLFVGPGQYSADKK